MEFIIDNPNIPQRMFDGQPMNVYQNPQQTFNFFDTKKVILFYSSSGSLTESNSIYTQTTNGSGQLMSGSYVSCSYTSGGVFKFTFVEDLKIDKMSDVFLDNMTIANASFNASNNVNEYGVALQINQLQQNTVSNNQQLNNRELIVINSQSKASGEQPNYYESKNKKFNYLGVLTPGNYKEFTGVLCKLDGTGMDNNDKLCFSIELVISNKD